MFDRLEPQPPDPLLGIIRQYAEDPRGEKIDLGVGVYRDEEGRTPVFRAVKQAERRLVEQQDSKAYLGPAGDIGFVRALIPHIFGESDRSERLSGLQTPGGTGALRLAAEMLAKAGAARIWMGAPSWPNHAPVFAAAGLAVETFEHIDLAAQTIRFDELEAAIDRAEARDALLLHGCCHNPTGADYSNEQWDRIAELLGAKGLFPLIDFAYHGLGNGLAEDAYGLRAVLARVPEALIAYSCDKNFGLYRDRVGALYALAEGEEESGILASHLASLARANWSMPPDHGAAAVRVILEDEELGSLWRDEVAAMRDRMNGVRDRLARLGKMGGVDFSPLGGQNGLFATLSLDRDQIRLLREEHAIYMAGSGRINIAGLNQGNLPRFEAALREVVG